MHICCTMAHPFDQLSWIHPIHADSLVGTGANHGGFCGNHNHDNDNQNTQGQHQECPSLHNSVNMQWQWQWYDKLQVCTTCCFTDSDVFSQHDPCCASLGSLIAAKVAIWSTATGTDSVYLKICRCACGVALLMILLCHFKHTSLRVGSQTSSSHVWNMI